jgi:hypothetical protein
VEKLSTDFAPVLFAFALPALAAALLAAGWWWRHGAARPRSAMALAAASALIVGCLWSAGPRVAANRSSARMARVLAPRLAPGDEVYAYHCYPQTLPVYLRRLMGIVSFQGELEFGISRLTPEERARRFPTPEQFRRVWGSGRTVYLVLEKGDLQRMIRDGIAPGTVLEEQERYLLMVNRLRGAL